MPEVHQGYSLSTRPEDGAQVSKKIRRIVLLGFMGSGKTTVGAALAPRLGWEHIDFDREIERREGRSIAQIFRDGGEAYFRSLERVLTAELVDRSRVVLSPGGGWITNPGVLSQLGRGTFSIWLRVNAEIVLRRLADAETGRPLLETPNPLATAERMLKERTHLYRAAGHIVDAGRLDVEAIIAEIEECARHLGLVPEQ